MKAAKYQFLENDMRKIQFFLHILAIIFAGECLGALQTHSYSFEKFTHATLMDVNARSDTYPWSKVIVLSVASYYVLELIAFGIPMRRKEHWSMSLGKATKRSASSKPPEVPMRRGAGTRETGLILPKGWTT